MRKASCVLALSAILALVGCNSTNNDPNPSKSQLLQQYIQGDDICAAYNLAPGCDLCLEFGFYGDGLCDLNMINLGLCIGPDPDCETAICGNGIVDVGEECDDGNNIDGDGCSTVCLLEGVAVCGNGVVEPNAAEECDGYDFAGVTCEISGYTGGVLICNPDCTISYAACTGGDICGNGIVEPREQCDGSDFAGMTCLDYGFSGGALACDSTCMVDLSGCTGGPVCGNGILDSGEECDGANLGGMTCLDYGFSGGTLVCDMTCMLDTSGCTGGGGYCGDGFLDPGEECDDGNNMNGDGCDARCMLE